LPDEDALTSLKDGFEKFDFFFPDKSGKLITLADQHFQGKPVIVQIMGSWCTNSLDETRFLVDFLNQHKEIDVSVVALAFEFAKTEEEAFQGIQKLKDDVGVKYPILLAQYGGANKQKAQEKLPMLNHVYSYPTIVFIDKKRKVRKITTGFNGPATGEKYVTFKKEFKEFVTMLANE
jgi:thiol-disulfide isomerase/thioredoxin